MDRGASEEYDDENEGVLDDLGIGGTKAAVNMSATPGYSAIRKLLEPMRIADLYAAKMVDLGYDDPADLFKMDDMELREVWPSQTLAAESNAPALSPAHPSHGTTGGHDRRHEAGPPGALRQDDLGDVLGRNSAARRDQRVRRVAAQPILFLRLPFSGQQLRRSAR